MNDLLAFLLFLLIINFLVFIHEFGHLVASKLSGLSVKEFSIGFGKLLFAKEFGGTKYSVRLIPLGGYVEPEGEMERNSPNGFRAKRLRVKAFVLLAGIFMNIVTAIVLFGIFLGTKDYTLALPPIVDYDFHGVVGQIKATPLLVTEVVKGGPSEGQINVGDVIVGINSVEFKSFDEFISIVKANQGKEVVMSFLDKANMTKIDKKIKIGFEKLDGTILGLGFPNKSEISNVYLIKYQSTFFSGIAMAFDMGAYEIKAIGYLLGNAISTGNYTEVAKSLGSPVAVQNEVTQIVNIGDLTYLLFLGGLVSLSLAMFNVLPFPALDGGQLFLYVIERVFKKEIPDKVLNYINWAGFAILLAFGMLVIFKDLIQYKVLDSFRQLVQSISGK